MTNRLEALVADAPVGSVGYVYGGDPPQPFFWHESSNNAFYISIDALNQFQRIDSLGGNPYVIPAIGLRFLALESYVSTLYKVAWRDAELNARNVSLAAPPQQPRQARKFVEKFRAVESYFSRGALRDRELALRLQEFGTLRNALFHDLTSVGNPQFVRTTFPSRVEYVTEAHLIQAAVLAIEGFAYFRLLFPGADLMPSIQVGLAYEKLDVLSAEVLLPLFEQILAAKGLSTAVACFPQVSTFQAQAARPLTLVIRHEGVMSPKPTAETPLLSKSLIDAAIAARPVDDDKFHVPNYVLRSEDGSPAESG